MSVLVLIVGALMVAAGGYEMFAGNGDILSERGWSAFIAGAVLVAGGIVTLSLGLVVRAIEGLRGALLRPLAGLSAVPSDERAEPGGDVAPDIARREPPRGPSFEQAPTAPVLAEAPLESALFPPQAALIETAPLPEMRQQPEPVSMAEPVAAAEPAQDDWLDHSFAELEREMAASPEPSGIVHSEPAHSEPVQPAPVEEAPAFHAAPALEETLPEHVPQAPSTVHEELPGPSPGLEAPVPHLDPTVHDPSSDGATISARETAPPPSSAVIGRYESEGTSYIMYADGSIDAQSEAGVYRFASMSELKAFIES